MTSNVCIIVDDEPSIRRLLRSVFEKCRLQVFEAEDAVSALQLIRKFEGRIDFVITDIKMPGDMNGIDLARSVRNLFPSIPVILISGFSEELGEDPEGFRCIPKPFLPQTILEAVERALYPDSLQIPVG